MQQCCIVACIILSITACNTRNIPFEQIEGQTRNLLELESVDHVYRSVIYYENLETFLGFIPTGTQKLLFRVNMLVRAGVDLSKDFSLSRTGSTLRISLPPPDILVVDADETSLFQYFVKEEKNRIDWRDVSLEIQAAKTRIRSHAIESGILEHAQLSAEQALTSFFSLLGFEDIIFVWQDL